MASKGNILVGTVGQGVMLSADDGESWTRASVRQGMHSDCIVRALREDARHPEVVFAGTDMGLYRSDDRGMKWRLLDNPIKGSVVWSVAIDPIDSTVMFAGTGTPSQPRIFRSTDGGKSWAALSVAIADDCPNVGIPLSRCYTAMVGARPGSKQGEESFKLRFPGKVRPSRSRQDKCRG